MSVPGVLNNAIDWASRAYGVDSNGKPVAIVSASIGMPRGAREIFVFLNMYPVNAPMVIVTFANDVFDTNGKLLHENTKAS